MLLFSFAAACTILQEMLLLLSMLLLVLLLYILSQRMQLLHWLLHAAGTDPSPSVELHALFAAVETQIIPTPPLHSHSQVRKP